MQVLSPSVKMVPQPGAEGLVSRPVFHDHDRVEGKVLLDPSCSQNGRLSISIEGAFEYRTVRTEEDEDSLSPNLPIDMRRHVFLSSSVVIPMSGVNESRSSLREAFTVRRKGSSTSLRSNGSNGPRTCEFKFEIPRGSRPGEEMPPTFLVTSEVETSRKRRFVEKSEVAYKLIATWESTDGDDWAKLEAPISFCPDSDFQSLDGSVLEPSLWIEMPLKAERFIPFQCAITLPHPHTFSRSTSIPFYVVYKTSRNCPTLTCEIASDATITVALIRQVTITPQQPDLPPTPPETPPPNSDDTRKLLKRFGTPANKPVKIRTRSRDEPFASASVTYKPLPGIPSESYSDTRTLFTRVCLGFPKRPRRHEGSEGQWQPNLPKGLHKDKIPLSRNMLPSVDWPGVSVKYYLDVSVLVGPDEVRARVPIRVL